MKSKSLSRETYGLFIFIFIILTLADMKALAPGVAYSESASTAFSYSVVKQQEQVSPAF